MLNSYRVPLKIYVPGRTHKALHNAESKRTYLVIPSENFVDLYKAWSWYSAFLMDETYTKQCILGNRDSLRT